MTAVLVGLAVGVSSGIGVACLLIRRARGRWVAAGQALEANAHGVAPPVREPRRIARQIARQRDWRLVDKQLPAELYRR